MTDVDWDLLADHLAGALDGTPEGSRVAHLVATDPGWARAAARLSGALDAVDADLRALPEPALPADVAARLDAVLDSATAAGLSPPDRTRARRGSRGRASRVAESAGAPAHVPFRSRAPSARSPAASAPAGPPPDQRRPSASGPGGRPRRRRRAAVWGSGLAVAAGVVAFAVIGLGNLDLTPPGSGDDASSDRPFAATEAESGQAPGGAEPPLLASGADYRRTQLPRSPLLAPGGPELRDTDSAAPAQPNSADSGAGPAADPPPGEATPGSIPAQLSHLHTDPGARQRCLTGVADAHTPAPATVEAVDFARFEGEPSVAIWITTGDGASWVWFAGPRCGTAAAGPDELYRTRLD